MFYQQERFETGENRAVVLGEVLAYRGRYADAARSYRSVGRDERALNLYVDLRMFNKAQVSVLELSFLLIVKDGFPPILLLFSFIILV